jgi:hypothetical protein
VLDDEVALVLDAGAPAALSPDPARDSKGASQARSLSS